MGFLPELRHKVIGVKIQMSRGCDFGVKLAKRARREISGIGVNLPTFLFLFAVYFLKRFFCDYNLAANLYLPFHILL